MILAVPSESSKRSMNSQILLLQWFIVLFVCLEFQDLRVIGYEVHMVILTPRVLDHLCLLSIAR